jgi:hypothetical protein
MKAQGALITMVKPSERKNRMERNNAEKLSQSSAWMKGALYNLGKAAKVGAAIVVAENIVGAYAHPTGTPGSDVVSMNSTTVHDLNTTSAHGGSRSSDVVFMNDRIPTQQADWRNYSNLADVPPQRNGSSSADVPQPKSSFLDEFGDRLENGSSYADLFEKPTQEQNQKLDGSNSSLDVPSPSQSGQSDSKNVTENSVVGPRDVNHSHSGDIERIKRMIKFANENPSRIAEMLRRNPKMMRRMVEDVREAISNDPEMMEFAKRAYQEFRKRQSGETKGQQITEIVGVVWLTALTVSQIVSTMWLARVHRALSGYVDLMQPMVNQPPANQPRVQP